MKEPGDGGIKEPEWRKARREAAVPSGRRPADAPPIPDGGSTRFMRVSLLLAKDSVSRWRRKLKLHALEHDLEGRSELSFSQITRALYDALEASGLKWEDCKTEDELFALLLERLAGE